MNFLMLQEKLLRVEWGMVLCGGLSLDLKA